MQVFLTGGTGFIGLPLTQCLLRRNWDVVALVRKPESQSAQALRRMGAQLTVGDVTERESMHVAMNGSDIVIHNAGRQTHCLPSSKFMTLPKALLSRQNGDV